MTKKFCKAYMIEGMTAEQGHGKASIRAHKTPNTSPRALNLDSWQLGCEDDRLRAMVCTCMIVADVGAQMDSMPHTP